MGSPFKGLKDKIHEIKIGETLIKVKPSVADIELFITMKKDMDAAEAKKITTILKNVIKKANPEEDVEDIEIFITENYGQLITELTILFGFTTREKIKKLEEDLKKKEELKQVLNQ